MTYSKQNIPLKRISTHFLLTYRIDTWEFMEKSQAASVCDTVTQPVGGLTTTSKDFTSLSGVKADCQPILKFYYRLGHHTQNELCL